REEDARENQRLLGGYERHPVKLLAIASADLYMGSEIRTLDRHLNRILPATSFWSAGKDEVHGFLQAAEATVGGGAGTHSQTYYNENQSGWPTASKVDWLPTNVQSVHLF